MDHCSFAYSALACFSMGMSGSASFQRARKSHKCGKSLHSAGTAWDKLVNGVSITDKIAWFSHFACLA